MREEGEEGVMCDFVLREMYRVIGGWGFGVERVCVWCCGVVGGVGGGCERWGGVGGDGVGGGFGGV